MAYDESKKTQDENNEAQGAEIEQIKQQVASLSEIIDAKKAKDEADKEPEPV